MAKSRNKFIKIGQFWIKAVFFLFVFEYFFHFIVADAQFGDKLLRFVNIFYIFSFFILIFPGIVLNEFGEWLEKKKEGSNGNRDQ